MEMLRQILEGAPCASSWPAPMPITTNLPPVVPFSGDLLPGALQGYVMDVAERQQSAPDFAAVATLCGLAAIVGNKVRIRPKQNDDWTVVPNLWGAIVGRPSAMKSPAMQSALAPLYSLQDELRKEWQAECRDIAADSALANLDAKEAKKQAAKALKGGDRDEARRLIMDTTGDDPELPPCPRLIVNDATVEKLGELLNENPNGLLLVRDELPGFLSRLESEDHQSDRAFYLESFNGDGSFTYDRIQRGTVHIENCTMSIIGGVQPSRIAPIVRGAVSGASNDGLIQRLQLAVWPDDRPDWKWVDRRPNAMDRGMFEAAFRRLHDMERKEDGEPLVLRFSPEAQTMFREWMEEIQAEARGGKLSSTLESHILKMPKTVASLALIFELIDSQDVPQSVGQEATARALDWADYLRSHAGRLYAAGQTMVEEGARLIAERRGQLPDPFTARDVHKKDWSGLTDRDAVASAIEILIGTHHCREVAAKADTNVRGRPTTSYTWNPALKVEG
ncbi:YfjI family protein [Antarcticirhabdus aurantiaca]|uniref:YfjI family protein n=1 Tax=Antarcticirhabdus aurantiaca TaxID=2606717 RepID=UPI00131AE477